MPHEQLERPVPQASPFGRQVRSGGGIRDTALSAVLHVLVVALLVWGGKKTFVDANEAPGEGHGRGGGGGGGGLRAFALALSSGAQTAPTPPAPVPPPVPAPTVTPTTIPEPAPQAEPTPAPDRKRVVQGK